jgi:hypothetical protein
MVFPYLVWLAYWRKVALHCQQIYREKEYRTTQRLIPVPDNLRPWMTRLSRPNR